MKLRQPIDLKYRKWSCYYPYIKRFFESAYNRGLVAYPRAPWNDIQYNIVGMTVTTQRTQEEIDHRLAPKITAKLEIKLPGYIALEDVIIRCTKDPNYEVYLSKELGGTHETTPAVEKDFKPDKDASPFFDQFIWGKMDTGEPRMQYSPMQVIWPE